MSLTRFADFNLSSRLNERRDFLIITWFAQALRQYYHLLLSGQINYATKLLKDLANHALIFNAANTLILLAQRAQR